MNETPTLEDVIAADRASGLTDNEIIAGMIDAFGMDDPDTIRVVQYIAMGIDIGDPAAIYRPFVLPEGSWLHRAFDES